MYENGGWTFHFGKGIATRNLDNPMKIGPSEVRFRIRKGKIYSFNGTFWMRGYWSMGTSDQEIVNAYEHWQVERVFGL